MVSPMLNLGFPPSATSAPVWQWTISYEQLAISSIQVPKCWLNRVYYAIVVWYT